MSSGMSENEETAGQIIMMISAAAILPGLILAAAASAGQWLLEHGVLVASADAVIQVPFTDGGLDIRRLIVATAAMVCIVALASIAKRAMGKGGGSR